MPSEGSQVWSRPRLVDVGTGRTTHVTPLSSETTTAWLPLSCSGRFPPQPLFGTYTVPSGATLRCPCSPTQSAIVYMLTPGPKVTPPSRLSEHVAFEMHCDA